MTTAERLRAAGSSASAIEHHYDLSDEFFRLWLGSDLVYSCALWAPAHCADSLEAAQLRKLDFFADRLGVRGGRLLDVGCGWGALLDRFTRVQGARGGVGLTLSPAQADFARARRVSGVEYRLQSWVDHAPADYYDAITSIESTEHFASDAMNADEKVEVYRAFFDRARSWLRPGGRIGLQLICLDNVGYEGSRPGRGPLSELIRTDIFPESMPGSLGEFVLAWETNFELDEFHAHPEHYRRTFRAWALAYRAERERASTLVGPETARVFERYFAAGEACFRLREHSLYRVVLTRRPDPKVWAVPVWPSTVAATPVPREPAGGGASAAAVRAHYDVSNDFYALWLGPTMMYSSGMWLPGEPTTELDASVNRKIDFFAARVLSGAGSRVLDVGCGWGGNLRRLAHHHGIGAAVGLTLSEAQAKFVARDPVPGVQVRLEGWADHRPEAAYDAIFSYGAFEHFARDGSTSADRIALYRHFFAACFGWLAPDGRVALETIANDGAPDTAAPLGRGPAGDFILRMFPESICPHLRELVLGFEPYFEVEVLRADGADFAKTFRAWLLRLREHETEAKGLVGDEDFRRFHRYLAASEMQFRTRAITNYRLVLHRRPMVRS